MRLKFDFYRNEYSKIDIELPESVLLLYCKARGVSIEDVMDSPKLHAQAISDYIIRHHEHLVEDADVDIESEVFNPVLEV